MYIILSTRKSRTHIMMFSQILKRESPRHNFHHFCWFQPIWLSSSSISESWIEKQPPLQRFVKQQIFAMKPQDQTNWNKAATWAKHLFRAPSFSKIKRCEYFVQPSFLLCFHLTKKHGYITGKQLANNTMDVESAPARWTSSLPRRLWVGFQKSAGTLKGEVALPLGSLFFGEGRCFLWTWISKKNRVKNGRFKLATGVINPKLGF